MGLFLYGNSRHFSSFLEIIASDAIPGRFEFGEIQLSPNLTEVTVYQARLFHPDGRELITIDRVVATADIFSIPKGEVRLLELFVEHPRVLLAFDGKTDLSLLEALDSDSEADWVESDELDDSGSFSMSFVNITLVDGEFLLSFPYLSVHLRNFSLDDASFHLVNENVIIASNLTVYEGQVVLLPELFELSDPRTTNTLRPYRALVRDDPWAAAQMTEEDLRPRSAEDYGALVIPIDSLQVNDFFWEEEGFQIPSLFLQMTTDRIEARGRMTLLDEKDEPLSFSAVGELDLEPTSSILAYFAPETFAELAEGSADELESSAVVVTFDVDGSLQDLRGQLELAVVQAQVGPWPIAQLNLPMSTAFDEPFFIGEQGLIIQGGGGTIDGWGHFDSLDGSYSFALNLSTVPAQWLLGPFFTEQQRELLVGTIDTHAILGDSPLEATTGLRIEGDLDSDTFLRFEQAREMLDAGSVLPQFAQVEVTHLSWDRGQDEGLPFSRMTCSGQLTLGPDLMLTVGDLETTSNFVISFDRDNVRLRGGVDLFEEQFNALRISGGVRSVGDLLSTRDFDARVSFAATVDGPFQRPSIDVHRLVATNLESGSVAVSEASTSFSLSFPNDAPQVTDGSLSASHVVVDSYEVEDVDASYSIVEGVVFLQRITIDSDMGEGVGSGTIRFADESFNFLDEPQFDILLDLENIDLAVLAPDKPITGSADFSGRFFGTPSHPQIEGTPLFEQTMLYDEWVDLASAEVNYSSSGIEVSLNTQFLGGEVQALAELDNLGNLGQTEIRVSDLHLEQLQNLEDLGIDLAGLLSVNLEHIPDEDVDRPEHLLAARPAVGYPDVQGSVIVQELMLNGIDMGSIAFAVDTYGTAIQANGAIAQQFPTAVEIPFDPDQPISIISTFNHVALEPFLEIFSPSLAQSVERSDLEEGRIEVSFLRDSGDMEVLLAIDRAWLEAQGRVFDMPNQTVIRYTRSEEDGVVEQFLSIEELTLGSEGNYLTLEGRLESMNELSFWLHGDAPVSLVGLLTDSIADATGVTAIDLEVSGTLDDPRPNGHISFHDALITTRGLGEDIALSSGVIEIQPFWYSEDEERRQTIEISAENAIEGSLFGGSVQLWGQIHLDEFQPHDLQLFLDATNLTYRIPDQLSVTFDTDLTLYAMDITNPETFFLSGNVFVQDALYFEDVGDTPGVASFLAGLFTSRVEQYQDPIWMQVPLLEFLKLDVTVRGSDNIRIRNEVYGFEVEAELHLDLTLGGTIKDPELRGQISVIEGEFVFQNRTFELTECVLSFDGSVDHFEIESCIGEATIIARSSNRGRRLGDLQVGDEHSIRTTEYTVQISIEGDFPGTVNPTFTSVGAALEERDIISLIIFGQTFDEVTAEASSQPGFELVFRELMDFVESGLQAGLELDVFNIVPSVDGQGTEITISDQVSARLNLGFDATYGQEETQDLNAVLTLTDWLSLEAVRQVDEEENVEVGGHFRLRIEFD